MKAENSFFEEDMLQEIERKQAKNHNHLYGTRPGEKRLASSECDEENTLAANLLLRHLSKPKCLTLREGL